MTTVGLVVALAVLAALTVMQLLLVAGLPIGHYAWGGQHRVLPAGMRAGAMVAIGLYAGFAVLLLSRAGVLPGAGSTVVVAATWVLFAYATLSILLNLASKSRHERVVQVPVSIVLTVAILLVALGPAA